ncbi:MAG: universal stress protein, partial [Anaerolineae bacterium]|nr:universal stress protein [Anaerolineae bacterium]MCB0234121.1 universal stress protein [Anaerolineae bacterium]MCB0237789.1 universal stress protein [Anaerolineae bacterium]
ALDGTSFSERILPFVKLLGNAINGEIVLLTVPEVPEPEMYGSMQDAVTDLRREAEISAWRYLKAVVSLLGREGVTVRPLVTGSRPATTIVEVAGSEQADLVMLATHRRGEIDRLFAGSVADRVIRNTNCPVFLVPENKEQQSG